MRRPEYDVKLLAGLKALKASPTACWLQGLVPREGNKGWAKHPSRTFAWFLPDQLVVKEVASVRWLIVGCKGWFQEKATGTSLGFSRTNLYGFRPVHALHMGLIPV